MRCLHLRPPGGELGLSRLCELAGFEQTALELLRLGRRLPVGIARLAPLLPDDASAQHLQPRQRLGSLPGGGRLCADHLESGLDLGAQVFEPEQVLGQLRKPLGGFLAALLDASHLGRLFEKGPPLRRRAHDDRLDVVLVDDRVRVHCEAGRGEHVDDVAPADPRAVQEVIALAVALHPALDGNLVVVDRKPAGGVVEDHRDLGVRGTRAALATGVDDLLHLLAADVARLA